MSLLLLLLYTLSFYFIILLSLLSTPKGKKMIEVFPQQNYILFLFADNFHSVCVCKILHFVSFNDWHTLSLMQVVLFHCAIRSCLSIIFFWTKIYQFTWELFSNDLVHYRIRFLQVGVCNFHFLRPMLVNGLLFKDGKKFAHLGVNI